MDYKLNSLSCIKNSLHSEYSNQKLIYNDDDEGIGRTIHSSENKKKLLI